MLTQQRVGTPTAFSKWILVFMILCFVYTASTQKHSYQQHSNDLNAFPYRDATYSSMNFQNVCILFLIILFILFILRMKETFYALASGDRTNVFRKVQYARKISPQEFRRQATDYTQQQVKSLINSREYQEKMREINNQNRSEYSRVSFADESRVSRAQDSAYYR